MQKQMANTIICTRRICEKWSNTFKDEKAPSSLRVEKKVTLKLRGSKQTARFIKRLVKMCKSLRGKDLKGIQQTFKVDKT